ncbi:hypothetical protein JHK85_033204 [Glycine max]|nr:hypothetical protein JHK85_033204 [Glycine max]
MDAQRALLDELMGAARNLTEEERKGYKEVSWDDKEVCGFYMVRFCPHDLFVNTRSDLVLRNLQDMMHMYRNLKLNFLNFVMDLDRRVRRGRERLAQEVEPTPPPPLTAEKSEQLSVLEEKIKNLLEQVESLGEAGKVDEAEALMRKVETLNAEKTALTQPQNDKVLMLGQEKKMALCEICGSFLVANDAAERTQSHVTGKQHVGYGMTAKEKANEEERLAREREAEERRKQREKESERRRRSDSSDRDRHRDKDHNRERDRYRDRDSDRERSREHDVRGYRDGGRGVDYRARNGRNGGRDRYRDRSRSRSPGKHSHRRSS